MRNIYFKKVFVLIVILCCFAIYLPHVHAKTIPSLCKVGHPSDEKIETKCRRLKKGESLESLFGEAWIDIARFNRIDRRHIYPGVHIKVPKRLEDIKNFTPMPQHYPPAEGHRKFILVDLSEQFLGAYEYGLLVFSAPVTSGEEINGNATPTGEFEISAIDSRHISSLYTVENTDKPYPMHYALRFYINKKGIAFWIHGRDVPGYPGSHGCIGLYDEEMQRDYYKFSKGPILEDAKILYDWVISPKTDDERFHTIQDGPRVVIIGRTPSARSEIHK